MANEVTYEVFALKYVDSPGRKRHENFIHVSTTTWAATIRSWCCTTCMTT